MNVFIPQIRGSSIFWLVILTVIDLSARVTEFVEKKLTKKNETNEPFPDEAPH